MDSGSSCLCDSTEPTDPTEYLEALKKKYVERTAKLQAQQLDLEKKILKMETFIGKKETFPQSVQSKCQCDAQIVPKVFPETPVRDMPLVPSAITNVIQNRQPVTQQCSFFQKMMENARSILSIKCQCASPFINSKTTSVTPATTTDTATLTPNAIDPTSSEPPTRDDDFSQQQKIVDLDNTLTDKSSQASICSCDITDPSTLHEVSCSCDITKSQTVQQSQQVSLEPSSSSPKENIQSPQETDELPTTSGSKSDKGCPWKESETSELTSGECSCEMCVCMSSLIIDDKPLENVPMEKATLPSVSVFQGKGDNPDAEVQVAASVETKGVSSSKIMDTASKCVTCCKNASCPSNKLVSEKGDQLNAEIQVASDTQNKGANIEIPKSALNIAVTCCQIKSCPNKQSENVCKGKCNPSSPQDRQAGPDSDITGQDQVIQVSHGDGIPEGQNRQDGQNQCAFVGSPLLSSNDFSVPGVKHSLNAIESKVIKKNKGPPCDCNTDERPRKICQTSVFSLTSNDILEMQNIAELAKKEKEMKAQIEELQRREKQYQEATRNVENLVAKTNNSCCCCQRNNTSTNMNDEIDKISRELRLENQELKSELMDMKIELKHCLEKIEGPMKQKLQTEKQKCECLQKELQDASKHMMVNQDTYSREMNQLKLQLCCACTNITELNQMNQRLKDEMTDLDCLCQKLEDDLIKQKVNEAETIKRLTNRKYSSGDAPTARKAEEFKSDSSLDVIARKLSKTIKDLAPCEECSKLPAELAGAAKCIKDLTDMVRKRKSKSQPTNGCGCQSRAPIKPPSKTFPEEDECCTCCGPRDGGGESARKVKSSEEKTVKTLLPVPESFVQHGDSSKLDVVQAPSSYYSTKGEPMKELPCKKIGTPCLQSKGTVTREDDVPQKQEGKRPCSNIGEPCKKDKPIDDLPCKKIGTPCLQSKGTVTTEDDVPKKGDKRPCSGIGEPCQKDSTPQKEQLTQVPSRRDKICKAPCSRIMEPGKDQETQEAMAPEKDEEGKLVQVPDEPLTEHTMVQVMVDELLEGLPIKVDSKVGEELAPKEEDDKPDGDGMKPRRSTASSITRHISNLTDNLVDDLFPGGIAEEGQLTETQPDSSQAADITSSPETPAILPEEPVSGPEGDGSREGVKELPDDDLSKAIAGQPEKDEAADEVPIDMLEPTYGGKMTGEREIPFDEIRLGEKFPFDVENKAYALDEPPADLHMTTTITGSGTLAVITEGPDGIIETTLTYTEDGNIEVVTELTEESADQRPPTDQALEKFASKPSAGEPGYETIDEMMPGHDMDGKSGSRLKPMAVDSSVISGPSGPEIDTSYTLSAVTAEEELTSKLDSSSSGVKPEFGKPFGFSSDHGEPSASGAEAGHLPASTSGGILKSSEKQAIDSVSLEQKSIRYGDEPLAESGSKGVTSGSAEKSAPRLAEGQDPLTSGATSTAGELPSGEVFTPDQVISDLIVTEKLDETPPTPTPTSIKASSVGIRESEISEKDGKTAEDKVEELKGIPGDDETQLTWTIPGTGTPVSRTTRDCHCQSKNQTDQSCQCCECKTVGITTSGDKQTITERNEAMGKTPRETVDETKTDTDSEFVTTSETIDNALAQSSGARKLGDTQEDASTMPIIQSIEPIEYRQPRDIQLVLDEDMLKKHPELRGKSTAEQSQFLKNLGYIAPNYIPPHFYEEYPQLGAMSVAEQNQFMEERGIKPQWEPEMVDPQLPGKSQEEQIGIVDSFGHTDPEEIDITEDLLKKHPQLANRSFSSQQNILKALGYQPSKSKEEIEVDENLLEKHPELQGKSKNEQQKMLRDMGYRPSKVVELDIPVDDETLAKHPQLVGKTKSEQQRMLKELGYKPSTQIAVDGDMLQQHPELLGKSPEEQQSILKNLGYVASKTTEPEISGKSPKDQQKSLQELFDKHPELADKSPEEQQKILESMGYETPKTTSIIGGKTPVPAKSLSINVPPTLSDKIDKDMLNKHPELVGKSPEEQEKILKDLVADKSASTIRVDEKLLIKHPELVGKSPEEQEKILKDLVADKSASTIGVDEKLLIKYPELVGKSPEEQEKILRDLVADKSASTIGVDEKLLIKHPELVGKSPEEQEKILKDLEAVEIASTIEVDEKLLKKHPELVGKSPEEQQKILSNLGYVEPPPSLKVSLEILSSHPELIGKPLDEQKEMLKNMGYNLDDVLKPTESKEPSKDKFSTPLSSSKDVSITCKAPCRSAAISKQSEKSIGINGIASSTCASNSRSISLQKRPSSRDDSASCKASCRSISVQNSRTRNTQSQKEVREIVAVRSDSATSSSSDPRQKEMTKKMDKKKSAPGEVPSIVSQLSDIERPAIKSTKKPKTSRKKRTRVSDCMRCDCQDPCHCSVCSPGRKKQALNRPVRSCDCPPNMMMMPQVIMVPPMQMTYSMPPTGHATNCKCNACLYAETAPPKIDLARRPVGESQTSDETDGLPKRLKNHSSSCECIDCLCLPKIKKLARTKECPVVCDTKQVYQVKVKCDGCVNAQNARRFVEQQSRSRIPISTTSPNPPKVRSDSKQAAGPSGSEGQSSQDDSKKPAVPPLSASDSMYNSVACDCPQCVCSDCPDQAKHPSPKTGAAPPGADGPKGDKNCCCKNVPCLCEPCTVDELVKKLREAEEKLAAVQSPTQPSEAPPPPPSGAPSAGEPDGECTCEECTCPRADLMKPAKSGRFFKKLLSKKDKPSESTPGAPGDTTKSSDDDEPCSCVECVCPGAESLTLTSKASSAPASAAKGDGQHPPDCDCKECTCPGLGAAMAAPASQAIIEACDCKDCKCSPCADEKKQAQRPPGLPAGEHGVADCDCVKCECSPCADPKIQKDKTPHQEGCDCTQCQCGGDAPTTSEETKGLSSQASKFTDMPEKVPHPPDCVCAECLCLEEIIQTELGGPTEKAAKEVHALSCACPECLCPECSTKATHAPGCKCDECICDVCDKKSDQHVQAARPPGQAGDQPSGPSICTCIKCMCDVCSDPSKAVDQSKKITITDQPHEDGCKCVECLCKECLMKLSPLKHADGCQCAQCLCVECLKHMQQGDQPTGRAISATASKSEGKGPNCTCAHCICIDCKGEGEQAQQKAQQSETKHDDNCTCAVCQCENEKAAGLHGDHADSCACADCQCKPCLTKAKPEERCTCPVCTCVTCSKVREVGAKSSAALGPGTAPSAMHGDHAESCTCADCQCKPCLNKAKPEERCTCPVCTCVTCSKVREVGAKSSAPVLGPGRAPSAMHGDHADSCTCADCQCKPCLNKAKPEERCTCPVCTCVTCSKVREAGAQSSVAVGAGTAPSAMHGDHADSCTCADCQCKPCLNKGKADERCLCSVCTCVTCSKEREIGAKSSAAVGAGMAPSAPSGDHPDQCKCADCQCKPCLKKAKPDESCLCSVCTCVTCTKKRETAGTSVAVGGQPTGMGDQGTHSPACSCSVCKCSATPEHSQQGGAKAGEVKAGDPPPFELSHRIDCNCQKCECVFCAKQASSVVATSSAVGGQPSSKGDQGTHDHSEQGGAKAKSAGEVKAGDPPPFELLHRIDCNCQKCECVICAKQQASSGPTAPGASGPHAVPERPGQVGAQEKSHLVFTDPPPFEPYHRIDCNCQKCDCIICAKHAASSGGHASGAAGPGVQTSAHVGHAPSKLPDDYVAPPFEEPVRINCICARCSCVFCNKQGPLQKSVGAQPSMAAVASKKEVSIQLSKTAPVATADPSIHPTGCICKACACEPCPQDPSKSVALVNSQHAAQVPTPLLAAAQSQHAAGAPSQHATPVPSQPGAAGGIEHPKNCNCDRCLCNPCKLSGQTGHPDGCTCDICTCKPCKHGPDVGGAHESKVVQVIKPAEALKQDGVPIHCNCPTCTCDEGVIKTTNWDKSSSPSSAQHSSPISAPGISTAPSSAKGEVYQSAETLVLSKPDVHKMYPEHPAECNCKQCQCKQCADPKFDSKGGTTYAPTTNAPPVQGEFYQSAETLILSKPDVHKMYPEHPDDCDCKPCKCEQCADPKINSKGQPAAKGISIKESVKAMDNVALAKSIQAANKENCECKEQIEEIKRTLEKIKCACNEAEFRSTQSIAQTMGKDMGPLGGGKPFVKQASVFGQTMSGLKMALNNLQAKCKAKDRMIEAMTAELSQRDSPEVFDKVLDESVKIPKALDYDQSEDVKSLERSQLKTNVLYAPVEKKDGSTNPCDLRCVASKGVEVRSHKHKKKKEKALDDCACSKPQIIQKEEKDCQKMDLGGFEVVDIRRITDDSLIVKWNAPGNDQIQGYDIFVNGTMATKVMSGTRTSAMMHSLDLSKSVQITIYAVTRCGRVEPPAIAIYEIKC